MLDVSFDFLSVAWKAAQDSRHQVPPPFCILPVVSHHFAWRIDNHGDIPGHICFPATEHPAQLLPHGVGGW